MAQIIGGIACSHTPTIGFAVDNNKQNDPVWKPIFEDFSVVQKWLDQKQPDVLFMIFNDHVTSFFFDHYSAFNLGIDNHYAVADEGGGARALPVVEGHAALAQHIGASLVADEFDMSFFQDKKLDHGCFSPLSLLAHHEPTWSVKIVPLAVGVLQFPIPNARRCYKLGQALRRAIESYPENLKVVIVATGGLSHQVHGARAGFNNTQWDSQFLDLIEHDPEALTNLTLAQYVELGGMEGSEIIMWLIMRGALTSNVKRVHRSYYLPSMTGIATTVFENQNQTLPFDQQEQHHQKMTAEYVGLDKIAGTHPFTLNVSVNRYRINRFLHQLINVDKRQQFLNDEEACLKSAQLTQEECELIRRRDWNGLIRYGVIFFMLEKLGAVVGVSNLHIYAAMRGQTLEQFQETRNAPSALYSVAGQNQQSWNKS